MLIDITKKINKETFVYPGDPKTEINEVCSIKNDNFRLTELKIGLHTSTHIDFPSHFLKDGKTSSDFDDINYFTGRVLIIDLDDFPRDIANGVDAIFIKTNNIIKSELKKYKSITQKHLNLLIKNKIKFIGTDFYTIEPFDSEDFSFHKKLLKNDILIIENLELSNVDDGVYEYFIFPLKIENTEASICRIAVKK